LESTSGENGLFLCGYRDATINKNAIGRLVGVEEDPFGESELEEGKIWSGSSELKKRRLRSLALLIAGVDRVGAVLSAHQRTRVEVWRIRYPDGVESKLYPAREWPS
jgi:hypothetical protein